MATYRADNTFQAQTSRGFGPNIIEDFMGQFPRSNYDLREQTAAMQRQRMRDQERERRARGPPPASRAALKNIPDVKIAAHDLTEETNRSCSVCLDDHELGGMAVKLPCAHIFHRDCVWEWLELHCTCPVCRFELETDDSNYEKERKVRMQGRKPRYRRRELEALSIPQVRNLARGQNVNIAGCLEKADIVRRIISSGAVEVVEAEVPEYDVNELAQMPARQLRTLMLELGIESQGCLEKGDLLERISSSRLVTVTQRSLESLPPPGSQLPQPLQPPQPPGPAITSNSNAQGTVPTGGYNAARQTAGRTPAPAQRRPWWFGGRGAHHNVRGTSRSVPRSQPQPQHQPQPQTRQHAGRPARVPPLEEMSVKELRTIMARLGVSSAGCIEKSDMVERIRGSSSYH